MAAIATHCCLASSATIATAAATGIATRSHGAKSGVRSSSTTASHAVPAIEAASTAGAAGASRPCPTSAATAGASALT